MAKDARAVKAAGPAKCGVLLASKRKRLPADSAERRFDARERGVTRSVASVSDER
jgi:hypothetical protein